MYLTCQNLIIFAKLSLYYNDIYYCVFFNLLLIYYYLLLFNFMLYPVYSRVDIEDRRNREYLVLRSSDPRFPHFQGFLCWVAELKDTLCLITRVQNTKISKRRTWEREYLNTRLPRLLWFTLPTRLWAYKV